MYISLPVYTLCDKCREIQNFKVFSINRKVVILSTQESRYPLPKRYQPEIELIFSLFKMNHTDVILLYQ